jgi:hypothetical protein
MISSEDVKLVAAEIANEYDQFPKRLIEDARSEINIAESERGRYILELLQNADDAQTPEMSSESTKIGESRIIFLVTDKYLYCANGGYQISKEGLDSICRIFLSPKKKNTPVIGFKGIGFKSVLAFTEQPEIFWHDGAIFFSRKRTFKFLKTKTPKAVASITSNEVPILRCPHLINLDLELNNDPILKRLWNNCATVFRFPFINKTARQNVISRLDDVKASTILFLNNLETIEIEINGSSKACKIFKDKVKENTQNDDIYDIVKANIQDGKNESKWVIISGAYKLPYDIKKLLSPLWKDTDFVKIAYAATIGTSDKLVPCTEYPLLHVFFPTDERVPFRIVMHGTFKTNIDRRLLSPEDPLNDYMIRKSVELLRDKVLPFISQQIDEPGRVMDFLQPPKDLIMTSIEGKIWSELKKILKNYKFVPNRNNDDNLCPKEVLLTPLTRKVEEFKSTVRGELANKFCYDTIDVNNERRETLRELGAEVFEIIKLPKFFEENFTTEANWIARVYAILDDAYNYLESIDSTQKFSFIEEVKKRELLLLSSREIVNAKSIDKDGAIFFPSSGNVPTPPKGLNLRFLDNRVVDEYLRIGQKIKRQTLFYKELGIDEYAAIPVINKVIIPTIKEFWKRPSKKIFKPEKVLEFLYTLLGEELPERDKVKAICLMPVPVKGGKLYAPAYSVYVSRKLTGNDSLEFIYGGTLSNFLKTSKDKSDKDSFEKWKKFYLWLGVSWLPRIIPQFENFEENKWRSCYWIKNKCSSSPHSKLPNWTEYCETLYEECKKLGDENPLDKYEVFMETSWAIDKFDEIVTDPRKSKRLLSVIADNWDTYYSKFVKCQISWRESRQRYFRNSEIESYFFWKLKNQAWIPSSIFILWSFKKPAELLIRTNSIYTLLGDLVPYVDIETAEQRDLLIRLGVKTSLDNLVAKDWWRIVTDAPRLLKPNEREIKPIYRKMLQLEGIEQENIFKDNFMANGKLLALLNDKWDFVDRDEVWYVENEGYRKLFCDKIPIFAIQHEEKKGAVIKRTFEINVLDECLHPNLAIGDEDKPASELLNQFLDNVKPFLAVRTYAQRPSRETEDISLIKQIRLIAVKSLEASYSLDFDGKMIEVSSSEGTYLDKQNNTIYVDVRKFQVKNFQSIEEDQKLARELGMQIAYYLDIDLATEFILLINSRSDETRYETLSLANISKNYISYIMESFKQATIVKPPSITDEIPSTGQEHQGISQPSMATKSANNCAPQVQIKKLELWNPTELGFEEPIEVVSDMGTKHSGAGSGGGSSPSHPGYLPDQEERKKVEKAGIAIVFAYEEHRHKREHRCSPKIESREKKRDGFDIISECEKEKRQIEVKSTRGDIQVVELTAQEWDAARRAENGDNHFLYRVRYLDKASGKKPDIIVIRNPYVVLMGEPTRFKVRLNKLRGKMQIIPLANLEEEKR